MSLQPAAHEQQNAQAVAGIAKPVSPTQEWEAKRAAFWAKKAEAHDAMVLHYRLEAEASELDGDAERVAHCLDMAESYVRMADRCRDDAAEYAAAAGGAA